MPTFDDPLADADEASTALRGLAHATRDIPQPADTYPVIGDLLAGVRSLRQILDQLAAVHLNHRAQAHDDAGMKAAGASSALAAADELHQAGTLLDAVHDRLDTAMSHSGRIAWHNGAPEPPRRWISVVFLEGEEADEMLDLIDRQGTHAAIDHLTGHDGEDTVQTALENGYVYDSPPHGALDRVATRDVYTLTYSPFLGHVSVLREYNATPDPVLLGIDDPAPAPARTSHAGAARPASPPARGEDPDWFARTPGARQSSRGLSL